MPIHTRFLLGALSLSATTTLQAQAPGNTSSRPPIRALGKVVATSTDSLGAITNVRALSNGNLLVNDVAGRRVLLLDSTLKIVKVVADTTPGNPNAYGGGLASLIAFRGDSTLFVDAQSLSMLVLDANGEVARVMSVPRAEDAMTLGGAGLGAGAFYSNGHLVYRAMPNIRRMVTAGAAPSAGAMPQLNVPDSMAITRVNLATRAVDTVGHVKIPRVKNNITRSDDGKISISVEINPLPVVDEWAVLSNGDIAIIRGRDYHVDWMDADGTRRSTPKIAFDWKRLTDEEKAKLIDSVKVLRDREAAANPSQGQNMARAFGTALGGAAGGAAGGFAPVMRFEMRVDGGAGGGAGGPVRAPQVMAPQFTYVSPSELPDYQPPFFATSTRADADNNLWVLTIPTKPQPAGSVYDVINAKGEAVERVLVPEGRQILGFGPGGVVYLAKRDGTTTVIERASVR